MKRFVIRQNIEHYRAMLTITTDPVKRLQIEKLLHKEEAKLKKYDEDNKKTPGSRKTAPGTISTSTNIPYSVAGHTFGLCDRLPEWPRPVSLPLPNAEGRNAILPLQQARRCGDGHHAR
jgi:hypothetical protein